MMNDLAVSTELDFADGVYFDIPSEVYHKMPRLSSGGMKKLLQSPAHFLVHRQKPNEMTDARLLGHGVHIGILEPERFPIDVMRMPDDAPTRPQARHVNAKRPSAETLEKAEWWAKFDSANAGKMILPTPIMEAVEGCIAAIRASKSANYLLSDGRSEVTILWTEQMMDPETGEIILVPCKARADYLRLNHDDQGMVDIKTTDDASPRTHSRMIGQHMYEVQAQHYLRGAAAHEIRCGFFAHIAVEDSPPHGVQCYTFEKNALAVAEKKCALAYLRYGRILQTGQYPAYPDEILPISLPGYLLKEAAV